ncbi:4Fe-4S binding protein [Allopusillimonas soli]|uniref:4Fe-4S binding protein n=1 Tax=Allopusillimonas soli TaxID=659016 RepID=A0A853FFD0_9BURK|nr:4Fe-4S binding protein [Allopusillimonas soli]NYT38392.1 4Fe-4S binding protein [Allopusillimonas soli]TEA72045.1 4Fe-4S binding protein [Allopusillimonas soli]
MLHALRSGATGFANFLRDHARWLRRLQWIIVGFYLTLLVVPALLPLPDRTASVFNSLTVFAQFAFWGVWWPFVLLSMPLLGRAWCGWFCPEGMLTEWASEHGQGHAIPRWMRWGGWPFVAFSLTTIYGQLVSVYQYPLAVLAVLGGSTAAAMVVGYRYGRSKRVWCKYLCPVNGVFQLLAKLAPWHYKVSEDAWRHPERRTAAINCAPLVPLRHMKGAGDCHMCGRCSDYRGAVHLTPRSPEAEVVHIAQGDNWQTALIVFGLMGLAVGAFLWSASPWFITIKQAEATWLVEHDIYWPLAQNAPWFILTHYPDVNDSFSWLDGQVILLFIFGAALAVGGPLYGSLWMASRLLRGARPAAQCTGPAVHDAKGAPVGRANLHRLAQGLIPAAGVGVFLGLSATTLTLLHNEGVSTPWATALRFILLGLALAWSLRLVWRISASGGAALHRRVAALALVAAGTLPFCVAWLMFFVIW